jgi:sugar O-acyltransferase (sialic acid O-acetyltransferase NeuD family)
VAVAECSYRLLVLLAHGATVNQSGARRSGADARSDASRAIDGHGSGGGLRALLCRRGRHAAFGKLGAATMTRAVPRRLVIFGASNIVSDLFDCALANGMAPAKVVVHLPEAAGERDIPLAARIAALKGLCEAPQVQMLDEFQPAAGELYLLGPTTPTRANLAAELERRFSLRYHRLIHPTAYVSPLAKLGQGVFVGANSVIGPGACLGDHVFVNRGVTIGHDTHIGPYSRIQPGANLGGLSRIGRGVTVAIGATLLERLVIGDGAFVGAGAVATEDVPDGVLVLGIPARFKKTL